MRFLAILTTFEFLASAIVSSVIRSSLNNTADSLQISGINGKGRWARFDPLANVTYRPDENPLAKRQAIVNWPLINCHGSLWCFTSTGPYCWGAYGKIVDKQVYFTK